MTPKGDYAEVDSGRELWVASSPCRLFSTTSSPNGPP